jgi:5-methylthioadenosine/S-adenosylhomocysteine deaminase
MLGGQLWRNTNADALVRGYICLYGAGTCTDELTRAAKICADNNGVVFAQHQNFLMDDTAGDDARFGRHAVTHFSELGLLSENTTFVHMNVLRDDEVRAVVASGMSLVWHPGNYMFYGLSGQTRCRMPELWRHGVNLTLGTDAAKAWTFGDLGLVAYLVARQTGEFLPAENILEMVTIGAAKAVGLADRIGSLEVGKRADVVIRSQALPECLPFLAPIREMILVSRSKSVDTVIVNGEVVVRAGRLTRLDEGPVYEAARLWSRRMVDRVGLNPSVPWPTVD